KNLKNLLSLLADDGGPDAARAAWWAELVRPGMHLEFGSDCPLQITTGPARDTAADRVRLGAEISCIAGSPLAEVRLELPEAAAAGLAGPALAERPVRARLKFAGIVREGDQFRMVWDTINDVRPADD